jgi:hypothetical protein
VINLDLTIVPALAALAGSLLGACSSVAATFVGQRLQARAARLVSELREREQLYGKFVEEAVPLFVDAIERPAIDPGRLMHLYSIVARIRLTASAEILCAAEEVGRLLLEAYERPSEDPAGVLARFAKGEVSLDPLRGFTQACRLERAKAVEQA